MSGWRVIAGLTLALAVHAAQADVWGFVDDKGVSHFAAEQVDERYELFFRGNPVLSPAELQDAAELPRPVAVPAQPSKLLAFFDVSPSYKSVKHLLRESAQTHGVDYELLQALIATESGFDAMAVSPRGAIGLMQVMPLTAQRYGVKADAKTSVEKKLADPRTNIGAGTRYLRDLLRLFPGQTELALAAYNAGEGAVQRAGNKVPNYRETQNYVRTVMQLYTLLKPPQTLLAQRRATAAGTPGSGRIHVELPGVPAGGARGRGNMPPALGTAALADAAGSP